MATKGNTDMGCPLHQGLEDWIAEERRERKEEFKEFNDKMDKIFVCLQTNHDETMKIRYTISNSLSLATKETAKKVEELCEKLTVIDKSVENSKWFTDWINDVRNHIFKYFIVFGVIGGFIWTMANYGKDLISKLIKS